MLAFLELAVDQRRQQPDALSGSPHHIGYKKTLLSACLSILFLLFSSSVALAHYCDDGYYVEKPAREECWWRYWTNNQTEVDLLLATAPSVLPFDSNGQSDFGLLHIEDSGNLRGYSAASDAAFGLLSPSIFFWQGATHVITKLAVNLQHSGPNDWTLLMEFFPAQIQNADHLALQVGDRWFNFSDARIEAGLVYWHNVRPDWINGEAVSFKVRAFPDSFVPRAIDGRGNNRAKSDFGRANAPLLRRVQGDISFGPNAIPSPADNVRNPRSISNIVFDQPEPVPDRYRVSDMVWQWGQFIDHDITFVPEGDPREPLPIPVPKGDPVFDPNGTGSGIIPFFRSAFDPATGTDQDNPRQQVNSITSFIDASVVYGSDPRRTHALRANDGSGMLKTSHQGRLLPLNTEGRLNAGGNHRTDLFLGGDIRANEQVGLTALHTLFVREHNRLADIISSESPALTGQEVFELTRKIVGAEIQAITYKEFLPLLLGPDALGPYTGYRPDVVPTVANEFSSAAFRFGHSLVSPTFLHVDSSEEENSVSLDEAFFNPGFVKVQGISGILLGLTRQRAQHLDTHIIGQIRNLLFAEPPGSGGRDLAAINIQRGRDHGIPRYNNVRRAYGLVPASSFGDVSSDPVVQAKLSEAYGGDIAQLELWPGGLAEGHLPGAMLGETFHAIVADQFRRLRAGDRFWFENDPYFLANANLLNQIHSVTLADVIRRNTLLDETLSDNVWQLPSAQVTPLALSLSQRTQRPHTLGHNCRLISVCLQFAS